MNPDPEKASLPTIKFSQEYQNFPASVTPQAARFLKAGLEGAPNTVRAYKADLDCYTSWCDRRGLPPFPGMPEQIANYISDLAEHYKVATVQRRLAMLSSFHQLQGLESPTSTKLVQTTMEGIKRSLGIRQHQAPALKLEQFRKGILSLDEHNNLQLRNKVVLLIGLSGAFRRGELASLNVSDLTLDEEGILIKVQRSKTDQLGSGQIKAIFYASHPQLCPVRTTLRYLNRRGLSLPHTGNDLNIEDGRTSQDIPFSPSVPFLVRMRKGDHFGKERLTDQSVRLIVNQQFGSRFSAHSLRASFVTIAKKNGASNSEIMAQTFHKTEAMIRRYTRFEDAREHNAGTKLGL
ncbi:MAG: tyrosine-type recombinase/integrase [Cyclobacteriaceae bacterium]